MAYGLLVDGKDSAGNSLEGIDSTTTSTITLGPEPGSGIYVAANNDTRNTISASTPSLTAVPSYNSSTKQGYASGDIVFGRPQDNVADFFTDGREATPRFASNSHYVIMKTANTLVTNVNGATYGLLVNNSAGSSAVMLDSRKISSAMDIIKSFEPDAFTGGLYSSMSNDDKDDNLVYDGSSGTDVQFKNTYVSMQGGITNSSSSYGSTTSIRVGAFYFDHSAKKIYYTGHYFVVASTTTNYYPLNNATNIIVGEFKA